MSAHSIVDGDPAELDVDFGEGLTRVGRLAGYPFTTVCKLEIVLPTKRAFGTGWLAGDRLVITAAHCVHQRGYGFARQVAVSIGSTTTHAVYFGIPSGWITHGQASRFDYGGIYLASPLGATHGQLQPLVRRAPRLHGVMATIAGHPRNQNYRLRWVEQRLRYAPELPGRLIYGLDLDAGDSGAPVIVQSRVGPRVVGIHTLESSENGTCIHINRAVEKNIDRWRAASDQFGVGGGTG